MTKNLGNAKPNSTTGNSRPRWLGKIAPALFPLAVAAIGYIVGKQFFGF